MWQNLPPMLASPGEFSVTYILRDLYPGCHPNNLIRIQMPSRGISRYRDSERLRTFSNVLEIDADGNHLPLDIFSNFPSLETLTLCANNIDFLRKEEYNFPHLRTLDLSFNRLQPHDLPKLGQLKALRELTLSRNRIRFITNDFCKEGNFPSLQILRLDQNCLRFQNTFYILSKLPKLTTLILDNNHFQEIPYLVYMGEKNDYEALLTNMLRLLQSYGNFLQKHHHQHIKRKLYNRITKVSDCSFTTLDTRDMQSQKIRWSNKNRQQRSRHKTKKAETTKKIEKSVSIGTDKNTNKILSEASLKMKFEEDILKEPCEKNSRIFNELMEEKWDGGAQGVVKEERISSVNENNFDDEKGNENKYSEAKLMKTSKDLLDDKVDRSVYELYHVPFPSLERLALRRCELTRQITILSCMIWPSLTHIDFTGNRVFDSNSHPGNVRAVVKYYSKASISIQTGYQFHGLLKSDQKLLNSINQIPRPVAPEPTSNIYNYVLSQQPESVKTYWKQVIEQRGGPIKSYLINSQEDKTKSSTPINGKINLHLGERPLNVDLKRAISQSLHRNQNNQKSHVQNHFMKSLPISDRIHQSKFMKLYSDDRFKDSLRYKLEATLKESQLKLHRSIVTKSDQKKRRK